MESWVPLPAFFCSWTGRPVFVVQATEFSLAISSRDIDLDAAKTALKQLCSKQKRKLESPIHGRVKYIGPSIQKGLTGWNYEHWVTRSRTMSQSRTCYAGRSIGSFKTHSTIAHDQRICTRPRNLHSTQESCSSVTIQEAGSALDCHVYCRDVGNPAAKDGIRTAGESADEEVVVATSAFGFGIDRADVRVVVDIRPNHQMRNYSQESG